MKTKLFFRVCLFLAASTLALQAFPGEFDEKEEGGGSHFSGPPLEQRGMTDPRTGEAGVEGDGRNTLDHEDDFAVSGLGFSEEEILQQIQRAKEERQAWKDKQMPSSVEEWKIFLRQADYYIGSWRCQRNILRQLAEQQSKGTYQKELNEAANAFNEVVKAIDQFFIPLQLDEELREQGYQFAKDQQSTVAQTREYFQKQQKLFAKAINGRSPLLASDVPKKFNIEAPISTELPSDKYTLDVPAGLREIRKVANEYFSLKNQEVWEELSVVDRQAYNKWVLERNENYHQKNEASINAINLQIKERDQHFLALIVPDYNSALKGAKSDLERKIKADKEALILARQTPADRKKCLMSGINNERERCSEEIKNFLEQKRERVLEKRNNFSSKIFSENGAAEMQAKAVESYEEAARLLTLQIEQLPQELDLENEAACENYKLKIRNRDIISPLYEQAAQWYENKNQDAANVVSCKADVMVLLAKSQNREERENYCKEIDRLQKIIDLYKKSDENKASAESVRGRFRDEYEAYNQSSNWYKTGAKQLAKGEWNDTSLKIAALWNEAGQNYALVKPNGPRMLNEYEDRCRELADNCKAQATALANKQMPSSELIARSNVLRKAKEEEERRKQAARNYEEYKKYSPPPYQEWHNS